MLRPIALVITAASLIGCSASAEIDPQFGDSGQPGQQGQQARLAAFAARDENAFPTTAPTSDDLRAAAIVDRTSGSLQVYNFTNQPITDAKVWVNGSYVYRIDRIPAMGSVTLNRGQFYNQRGNAFSRDKTPIKNVQLQRGEEVFNLQGPVYEAGQQS